MKEDKKTMDVEGVIMKPGQIIRGTMVVTLKFSDDEKLHTFSSSPMKYDQFFLDTLNSDNQKDVDVTQHVLRCVECLGLFDSFCKQKNFGHEEKLEIAYKYYLACPEK